MKRLIPVVMILALLLAACGAPEAGIEGVTAENYPRRGGSEEALPLIQRIFETVHTQYSGGDYPVEALGAQESLEALLAGGLDLVIAPGPGAAGLDGAELEITELGGSGLCAVRPAGGGNTAVESIVDWLAGEEGRACLADLGYTA